jgi:hypothetical protein
MRKMILFLTLAALALPSIALAKGPSAATMEGPGGGGGITFSGNETSGSLGMLTEQSGWFQAAFESDSTPVHAGRPQGDLGPKYTVTYTVPGPENNVQTIVQDIYPYAAQGPVTYMAPGQPIFDMRTPGGWFQAGPELKQTLVAAGLPETAARGSTDDESAFPTTTVGLLAFALLLVGATALLLRRRARPAAA